jgi:hypothetical protein
MAAAARRHIGNTPAAQARCYRTTSGVPLTGLRALRTK